MGLLPLFSYLSRPLYFRTKVAASRDKYNVLLLGLDNSCFFNIPRYAVLYYSYSILLLTIYSVTSTFIPSTIATLYTSLYNPTPFAAITTTSIPTPKQWEADFTNIWGMNAAVRHYG